MSDSFTDPGILQRLLLKAGQFPNGYDGFAFNDRSELVCEENPDEPFVSIQAHKGGGPVGPGFDILLAPQIDPRCIPDIRKDACLMKIPVGLIIMLCNRNLNPGPEWHKFDYFGIFRNMRQNTAAPFVLRPVIDGKPVSEELFPALELK